MKKLRSHKRLYGPQETALLHQGALRAVGVDMDRYNGQPIIGIANTWSEFNNCNMSLKTIASEVKKGVTEAGGIPLEFPVISLGEELMKPSAMLYRASKAQKHSPLYGLLLKMFTKIGTSMLTFVWHRLRQEPSEKLFSLPHEVCFPSE